MKLKPHQQLSKLSPKNLPPASDSPHITVSFKTYSDKEYCLSRCTEDEIKEALGALRALTSMTWTEAHGTGGKPGNKVGIGYTHYTDDDLKGAKRPGWLAEDVGISGIRASKKFRIYGYRRKEVFNVLWFDKDHEIVPSAF